jgi:AcrR family transcriptional regulator
MTARRRSAPYHHGDLRRALIAGAVAAIEEGGPSAMSLRYVAREVGVTHAAATHHFGDKAGLLTAVAVEGYRLLAEELKEALQTRASFLEVGVAYVRFAVRHRAHFEVMFRPELYHPDDAELGAARAVTAAILYGAEREGASDEQVTAGVAAWALVHGMATLWLNGSLPPRLGSDPEDLTRRIAPYLRTRRR